MLERMFMPLHIIPFLDRRAIARGLVAFFVLVICLPIIVVLIASFGPLSWMEDYIDPAFQLKAVLPVLAGAITAWSSQRSPISSTLIVGALGAMMVIAVSYLSAAPAIQSLSASRLLNYVFATSAWCLAGGICAVLFRRRQTVCNNFGLGRSAAALSARP